MSWRPGSPRVASPTVPRFPNIFQRNVRDLQTYTRRQPGDEKPFQGNRLLSEDTLHYTLLYHSLIPPFSNYFSGLGAEVAKNVILAGVRSVTLHDDRPSSLEDLSSQFCLGAEEAEAAAAAGQQAVGRARASVKHLRELNPYVDVRLLEVRVFCGCIAEV